MDVNTLLFERLDEIISRLNFLSEGVVALQGYLYILIVAGGALIVLFMLYKILMRFC